MEESVPQNNLEFFDSSNASEEEIKHIRQILYDPRSHGSVELPWEVSLPSFDYYGDATEICVNEKFVEEKPERSATAIGSVVGQALLYALPPAALPPQLVPQPAPRLPDVLPPVETFMTQMPAMSTASPIAAHYPASYLVQRTLPYLRAYPSHVGMPLLTCTLPASGELTHHVPSHYSPFMPMAAPVPRLDTKPLDSKDAAEVHYQAKAKGPTERQYNRRGKRKPVVSNNSHYYSQSFSHNVDNYQECIEEQVASVPSSLPLVPVPMPPSTFAVTSGTIPMHSYPPGLHPMPYTQISGPQAPTTPVYYVPVFNHSPYSSYIPSASVIMNVGVAGSVVHPPSESECSGMNESADDGTKSTESLAASSESIDCDAVPPNVALESKVHAEDEVKEDCNEVEASDLPVVEEIKEGCLATCEREMEKPALLNSMPNKEEQPAKNVTNKLYSESSSCWADLFRNNNKQCPQMNGLDRGPALVKTATLNKSNNLEKELNGKIFDVPNNSDL